MKIRHCWKIYHTFQRCVKLVNDREINRDLEKELARIVGICMLFIMLRTGLPGMWNKIATSCALSRFNICRKNLRVYNKTHDAKFNTKMEQNFNQFEFSYEFTDAVCLKRFFISLRI